MIYFLLLVDIVFTVGAQLALRVGAQRIGTESISFALLLEPFRNVFILTGLILFAVSFFIYIFILSKLQLSIVYPVATGSILALITVASHFFLKEALTGVQAIGIVAILVGVVLVLLPR
ncbi:MAG: hypothetical protein A3C80_00795 [Candidatus Ryanbacteria bacterium RIFCSPHIGHO2_02_FULL_45_43]|uniref:EamA domain-containing protein n=1 Tax=Candidatus Ryanbacteria bacterium RIFCSPHIGHO2_01_45_13 TaxID=1802112 RepID=A0A1G2FX62_9BACT|nr:MAG: hypothetical protein A2718_02185 [Candidatus Ryanbacteria bacterium RIFCSPHIGHO2_01_FULL_44_130]OGZ42666.1 MAG: hypothetical protein A2W41_02880 [Candidatus Ryanbacteria bacterium RIFCSPHIGHO2_01_45_13]OGZ48845.1 MAG: hypothetical protein A3C80_00795 [Candidatus Ryanbacteria bacterium RIFCSPHIGHO2_02_FULL_45_43]OGZ50877.1 MAG: hypothetical protein A3E55_02815 [Candidatus Ryanbacteria bacterium RIFCSPHIGHO2_12_FULL_44_20]OGZ52088.1 MAG: hypothetical protein A3A17_01400 [Candidatus Ryanba